MAYAVQALTQHQTYPESPPGADLHPKEVCNLDPEPSTYLPIGRAVRRTAEALFYRTGRRGSDAAERPSTGWSRFYQFNSKTGFTSARAPPSRHNCDPLGRRVHGGRYAALPQHADYITSLKFCPGSSCARIVHVFCPSIRYAAAVSRSTAAFKLIP